MVDFTPCCTRLLPFATAMTSLCKANLPDKRRVRFRGLVSCQGDEQISIALRHRAINRINLSADRAIALITHPQPRLLRTDCPTGRRSWEDSPLTKASPSATHALRRTIDATAIISQTATARSGGSRITIIKNNRNRDFFANREAALRDSSESRSSGFFQKATTAWFWGITQ